MRKRNSKLGWTTTALGLTLALAGCGNGNNGANAGDDAGASASSSATSQASASASPAEKVTLEMFGWSDSGYKIDEVIKRFENGHPGIHINFTGVGSDNYNTSLKAKLLSGDGPDLFWMHPGSEFQALVESGYAADISDLPGKDNVQAGALNSATSQGKLYGIPNNQNLLGMYYNKKVFGDLGIDVPTTWSELMAAAEKIKAAGIAPFSIALGDWPSNFWLYPLTASEIFANNPDWYADRTAGTVSFAEWAPLYDQYQYVIKNYAANGPSGALGMKYDQHLQLLVSGKAAMLVQGTWALSEMKKIDPNVDVGMFPLNGSDDPNNRVVPQGVGAVIGAYGKSEHLEAVKQFLSFMTTADSYQEGDIPVLKGIDDAPEFVKEHMLESLDQGKSTLFMDVPWPAGFVDGIVKDIDSMITLHGKPSDAVKGWDKIWDDKIK